jgi:muramoyltetrapeptide carboxypeptidase
LQDGFGKTDDMPPANEAALWRAVLADKTSERPQGYTFDFVGMAQVAIRTVRGGVATGRLTGGNLSVISSLMGTPFEIETAGRILFLEDVSERLYRVDRYLSQLRLAGKLQAAAGVLLGSFSYDDEEQAESEATLAALIDDYLDRLDIPVIAGFPAGHAQYNLTLPMGALIELDATNRRVRVCENAVTSET